MNMKRLIIACVVVFLFVFGYNWVLHGKVLSNAYMESAQLWRDEAGMKQHFGWLLLGQLLMSVMFCVIYALRRGTAAGPGQGAGYGFLVALLLSSGTFISYAVEPLPGKIAATWFIGDLIQLVIAGAILGAIYRPPTAEVRAAQPAPA